MTVKDFIEWLKQFPDQDATIEVLECHPGAPYTEQGGVTSSVKFDPDKHADYTDMRGNPFVGDDAPYKNDHTLLLGLNDN